MKMWVLSDLHLTTFERALQPEVIPTIPEADLAVIAGDIGDGIETSAAWLAEHIRPHMPVLWTLGNHEFYGGWFKTSRELARRRATELGLTLLDDEVAVVDGVRFVGSTLWTDYNLYADGDEAIRRDAFLQNPLPATRWSSPITPPPHSLWRRSIAAIR